MRMPKTAKPAPKTARVRPKTTISKHDGMSPSMDRRMDSPAERKREYGTTKIGARRTR